MYALIKDGIVKKYPYSIDQLRRDNPQTSFPKSLNEKTLASYGVYAVQPQPTPDHDYATQNAIQSDPVRIGDQWTETWTVINATPEEIAERSKARSEYVRIERDSKLADSDWTQTVDSPVDKSAWAAYRQALRDVPSQPGFPWQVSWPAKP